MNKYKHDTPKDAICPLLPTERAPNDKGTFAQLCVREQCAWWISALEVNVKTKQIEPVSRGRCAVVDINFNLPKTRV